LEVDVIIRLPEISCQQGKFFILIKIENLLSLSGLQIPAEPLHRAAPLPEASRYPLSELTNSLGYPFYLSFTEIGYNKDKSKFKPRRDPDD
jgi:hypothetical protein